MTPIHATPAPPPILHLLVTTANQPFHQERYKAMCGASGITKRMFVSSLDKVTCPVCKQVHRKETK
jgi:hypothetical protein